MLLFVRRALWSIIDDSGFVVSSVVSANPALLSFHMLAGNLDRALVDFSYQAARETQYQPQTFMGILHYLPWALAAYETRATQAAAQQMDAATRRWQERYAQ